MASVVASVDDNPAIYPGSTRLLPCYQQRYGQDKAEFYPQNITENELIEMMKDMIKVWKKKHTCMGSPRKPSVWFYRGGFRTELHSEGVYTREARAIESAYRRVFGDGDSLPVRLAFIGVTENLHKHGEGVEKKSKVAQTHLLSLNS